MRFADLTLCCAAALLLLLSPCAPAMAVDVQWGLGSHAKNLDPTHENLNWGFRHVAWGTEKDDVEERHVLNQCMNIGMGIENCNVADANLSLGQTPLKHVRFLFLNDAFYGVSLKYAPIHQKDIYQQITELIGPPTGEQDSFPLWDLEQIIIWASDTHFSLRCKTIPGSNAEPDSGGTF